MSQQIFPNSNSGNIYLFNYPNEDPNAVPYYPLNSGNFINSEIFTNEGDIYNENGATFTGYNPIDYSPATFDNYGTLTNSTVNSEIVNYGILTNESGGTFKGDGSIDNYGGTFDNYGTTTCSIVNLGGTFDNYGTFNSTFTGSEPTSIIANSGLGTLFTNESGGTIDGGISNDNGGTFDNFGTLTVEGGAANNGTLTNESGGTIDNFGTLTNQSITANEPIAGTIDNSGTLIDEKGGEIVNDSNNFNNTNTGILAGTGIFVYNLTIGAGILEPGGTLSNGSLVATDGTFTVQGDFSLTGGALDISVDGVNTGEFDILSVTDTASLTGGTINFSINEAAIEKELAATNYE